jgi:hypothetical protein
MRRFIMMLFFGVFTCLINAQTYAPVTIYTPNQTAVAAGNLTSADLTSTQKNDSKNFWLNCYNNRITFVGEATYKYNCHGYA